MARNNIKVELQGLGQLRKDIEKLADDKDKRKEILKILRRQAAPVLQAVKANTPVADKAQQGKYPHEPGNLRESIKIFTGRSKTNPAVYIGPKVGRGAKNDGYYGWFLIEGTKTIAPNDFIGDAFKPFRESSRTQLSDKLARYIENKWKNR